MRALWAIEGRAPASQAARNDRLQPIPAALLAGVDERPRAADISRLTYYHVEC